MVAWKRPSYKTMLTCGSIAPHTMYTTFKADTGVIFTSNGSVYGGTLAYNTYLYTNQAHSIADSEFAAGDEVSFLADGSVA